MASLDEMDPANGPIIDLTGDDDDAVQFDTSNRKWTDPTPESVTFRSLADLAKV